jgi:hypothetical protein
VGSAPISPPMIIVLLELLEEAWARAPSGREAAAQNEVLRLVRSLLITISDSRRVIMTLCPERSQ